MSNSDLKITCAKLLYVRINDYEGFSFEQFFIAPDGPKRPDRGVSPRNLLIFGENSSGKTSLGQIIALLSYTPFMRNLLINEDGSPKIQPSRFEQNKEIKIEDTETFEEFKDGEKWSARFALQVKDQRLVRSNLIFFEITSFSAEISITSLLNNEALEDERELEDFSYENLGNRYIERFRKYKLFIKSYSFSKSAEDGFRQFSIRFLKEGYHHFLTGAPITTHDSVTPEENQYHSKLLDAFLDSRLEFVKLMDQPNTEVLDPQGRIFYFNSDLNDLGSLCIRETLKDLSTDNLTEYLIQRGWYDIFSNPEFIANVHQDLQKIYDNKYLLHIEADAKQKKISLIWEDATLRSRKKISFLSSGANEAFWLCCLLNMDHIINSQPLIILDEPCMHMTEGRKKKLYQLFASKAFEEKNNKLVPKFQLLLITHNLSTLGIFAQRRRRKTVDPSCKPLLTYLRRDSDKRNSCSYKDNRFSIDSLEYLLLAQIEANGEAIETSELIEKLDTYDGEFPKDRVNDLRKLLILYTFLTDAIKHYKSKNKL